ncbi:MAG: NADP-dependent isocitrate dehydrogenase [Pseudomonadales bacterium]|nr:NADP-dependent isocitrate dehydrogenase [Pseudomonadales bacterium]
MRGRSFVLRHRATAMFRPPVAQPIFNRGIAMTVLTALKPASATLPAGNERTSASRRAAPHRICIAQGDGIGPEIMEATLRVLAAARAPLEVRPVQMGLSCWNAGVTSGIDASTWDSIRELGVLLKGPLSTPQGAGMKSLNVTLRKRLGLFANVRPVRAYMPYVHSHHPGMDLVVIRENEEDLYAGIEHRQTDDVVQCLKLVSRQGSERVIRYAFEYARTRKRQRLTCMTKDNIMKLTDGLFHRVFDEVAREYPDVETEHLIVDIGMARAAAEPDRFDVIVTPNLYGDILSDVVAEVSGSVGMAPSANIGRHAAVFEAIHGSAPDIAGRNLANPSGLLLAAAKMLAHLGEGDIAELIHDAWLRTIEDGVHTADVYQSATSVRRAGTDTFADAVIERLGERPRALRPSAYPRHRLALFDPVERAPARKCPVGVDVFVHARTTPEQLAGRLCGAGAREFRLQMITNRGVQVWPAGLPETLCTDHWRCRFVLQNPGNRKFHDQVLGLLHALSQAGIEWIKTEQLYTFDEEPGYSLAQGQ